VKLRLLLIVALMLTSADAALGQAAQTAKPAVRHTEGKKSREQDRAKRLAATHRILDQASDPNSAQLHDVCAGLIGAGDSSSVPHLIRVLKLFPDHEPGKLEVILCTQGHCVEALERITKAKPGYSYSSWRRWWNQAHPEKPIPAPDEQGRREGEQNLP
jgi:hypothetical protein